MSEPTHEDPVATAIVAFLRANGADGARHARGRNLLDHLMGSYAIARRWGEPEWLQHAALLHSVYGTDAYAHALIEPERRAEVAAVAGARAERIAYLFCMTPRRPLFAGTHLWARELPARGASYDVPPTRRELDAVVLVHMANLAEQARAADGSPGRWLVRLRDLAELIGSDGTRDGVVIPSFVAQLATFTEEDEARARRAYTGAIGRKGEDRDARLALLAAQFPVIPEPCGLLAEAARGRGDDARAGDWDELARHRLTTLGTTWDKRRTYDDWLEQHDAPTGPEDGRGRFQRYIESLTENPAGRMYPGLTAHPWHDPREFPLTGYLEANYPAIRDEILALDAARFQRESERIERTGNWDVAFFYERGRRRDDVCAACPVTAHGIEAYPTVRTLAGLIYASRMRPGTEISPHRGPTNLRLRCHLGITVPEGDCGIRVGELTRRWEEGRCLVFDDSFEHEAWNRTGEDRIVLILDVWHPDLSPTEVMLLEGLHGYAALHARRLSRYWAVNAEAARGG